MRQVSSVAGSGRWFRGAIVLVFAMLISLLPSIGNAATSCGTSNGVAICLNAPAGTLSGDVAISVTTTGSLSGVSAVIFYWGPTSTSTNHLLQDFASPYQFTWRTDQYVDANQFLIARVQKNSSSLGSPVSLQVAISNGNSGAVPQNPTDWETIFQPRAFVGDPVIAAVGDAGDGSSGSDQTAATVLGSNASLLLYLGDLYEKGTPAEFDHNYGRASFDVRGGASGWGSLASFTKPTLGNHEGQNLATWRNYWHGRPDWETFVFGGVRFLDLDSECSLVSCTVGGAQYQFIQTTLASNTYPCVVAFWHRPVLSAVQDSAPMQPIWALLANQGVDLVLNGHTHTMERYYPMNAALQVGQTDSHMVEVISGSGGHNETAAADTDPRTAWQVSKVTGPMFLTAFGGGDGQATRLDWDFRTNSGSVVAGSSSSVDCGGTVDTAPPSVPGKPSGLSNAPGSIDLTWDASTDDVADSISYSIYRDGGPSPVGIVASTSSTTVGWTDTGLSPDSVHTYVVTASDGVNTSGPSQASDPITVQQGSTAIFQDGFDGGFTNWSTVVGLTLDATNGSPDPPSASAKLSNASGYASKVLGGLYSSVCASERANLTSIGTSGSSLLRLKTAGGGPIARVAVSPSRVLSIRSDVSGAQISSGVSLPTGSWNTIELCGTVGASGTWSLYLNGSLIAGPWTADTGSTPVGQLVIGTPDPRTVSVSFDDVRVDLVPGV